MKYKDENGEELRAIYLTADEFGSITAMARYFQNIMKITLEREGKIDQGLVKIGINFLNIVRKIEEAVK